MMIIKTTTIATEKTEKEQNPETKTNYRTNQNRKTNKYFPWISAVNVLSPTVSHSSPPPS